MLVRYISSHNAWVGLNHPIRMGLMDDLRGCQWIVKTRGDFSFLTSSRFCKHFIPFLNFAIRHNFPAFFIIASPQGGERDNKLNNWPTASVLCCGHQCQFRKTNVELLFISEKIIKVAWLALESFSLEGKTSGNKSIQSNLTAWPTAVILILNNILKQTLNANFWFQTPSFLWLFFSSIGWKHSQTKISLGSKGFFGQKKLLATKVSKIQIQNPKSTNFAQIDLLLINMNLAWIKGER